MDSRAFFGCLLTLAGCALQDPVVIEVDADSSFMGRIDNLDLNQPSLGDSVTSIAGNPVQLPASFSIAVDDARPILDAEGGLNVTARAFWKTVEIGQGIPSNPSGLVTFHTTPVHVVLTTRSLDILRHCENDIDCSTGYCGSEDFSDPQRFCTKHCSVDSDCPPQAKCSSKYGTAICMPTCTTSQETCKVTLSSSNPNWQCDVDHDGLCGFTK